MRKILHLPICALMALSAIVIPRAAVAQDVHETVGYYGETIFHKGKLVGEEINSNNPNMMLGNPSFAAARPKNKVNFLSIRKQFAMAYNDNTHMPWWVSWHIDSSNIGDKTPAPIKADSSLPTTFQKINPGSYTSIGYDEVLICPPEDRSFLQEDCDAVSLTSNSTPMTPELHKGPWTSLESYCRTLAKDGDVYVTAGPVNSMGGKLGDYQIPAPNSFFKVIVFIPNGKQIGEARVICTIFRNVTTDKMQSTNWTEFKVKNASVVEQMTSMKFFGALPVNVQNYLRTKTDN